MYITDNAGKKAIKRIHLVIQIRRTSTEILDRRNRYGLQTTSVRAAGSGSAPGRQRSWYLTTTMTTRSRDQAQPPDHIGTRRGIRFSPQAPAELASYCPRR